MVFKRKTYERKIEAKKAEKHVSKFSNVRNKLGLSQSSPDEKVKYELTRIMGGNPNTWKKALGLTEDDFKEFGVLVYDKS